MDILNALVPLIVPILLPIIIAGSVAAYQFFMQRSPSNMHQLVNQVASTVVSATEQYYGDVTGNSKKLEAERAITAILIHLHIAYNQALIDAAIESAVYTLNAEKALFARPALNTSSKPEATPNSNT